MGTYALQRGRAHVSAESKTFLLTARADYTASTGPRSRERGEMLCLIGEVLLIFASTGPRSRERGEIHIRTGWMTGSSSLQRGRAHVSAESQLYNIDVVTYKGASTGPRSRERGEKWHGRFPKKNATASTGPRSRERGEDLLGQRCHFINVSFNGAALT